MSLLGWVKIFTRLTTLDLYTATIMALVIIIIFICSALHLPHSNCDKSLSFFCAKSNFSHLISIWVWGLSGWDFYAGFQMIINWKTSNLYFLYSCFWNTIFILKYKSFGILYSVKYDRILGKKKVYIKK